VDNKKILLIVLGILALLALCACGSCAGLVSLGRSSSDTSSTETPIQQAPVAEDSTLADSATDDWGPGIPGLAKPDVTINLEDRYGLEFGEDSYGADGMSSTLGSGTDPVTGAMLDCMVYWTLENGEYRVPLVEFSCIAPTNPDDINAAASAYLGYCATIPYTGADPAAAKAWIEENIAAANTQGQVLETVIGDARFTLYGADQVRTLEITNVATPK